MTENFDFPNATIKRIIKSELPEGVSVATPAAEAINFATSTFITYITDIASKYAIKAKRQTIGPEDVVAALRDAEFMDLSEQARSILDRLKSEKQKPVDEQQTEHPEVLEETVVEEEVIEV
ncbi:hypothetical protein RCL1_002619 [Eukaryota sp. TZLM3-RCL]